MVGLMVDLVVALIEAQLVAAALIVDGLAVIFAGWA